MCLDPTEQNTYRSVGKNGWQPAYWTTRLHSFLRECWRPNAHCLCGNNCRQPTTERGLQALPCAPEGLNMFMNTCCTSNMKHTNWRYQLCLLNRTPRSRWVYSHYIAKNKTKTQQKKPTHPQWQSLEIQGVRWGWTWLQQYLLMGIMQSNKLEEALKSGNTSITSPEYKQEYEGKNRISYIS